MVLLPFGQPDNEEHRSFCAEVCVRLGGDVARILDGPFGGIEHFISYAMRINSISDGVEAPIIALTRTNPLGLMVVNARRRIEAAVPALVRASWLVLVDAGWDPFFEANARGLGEIDGDPASGATWTLTEGSEYTVVSRLSKASSAALTDPIGATPPPSASGCRASARVTVRAPLSAKQ